MANEMFPSSVQVDPRHANTANIVRAEDPVVASSQNTREDTQKKCFTGHLSLRAMLLGRVYWVTRGGPVLESLWCFHDFSDFSDCRGEGESRVGLGLIRCTWNGPGSLDQSQPNHSRNTFFSHSIYF